MTRLRVARLRPGLTLQEAARHAGIAPAYLATLERRGATALTWPRARRLAAAYRVDPVALVGRTP